MAKSTLSHKSFAFFSVETNCQVVLSNDKVHFFSMLEKTMDFIAETESPNIL